MIMRYLLLALLAVSILTFTACDDDDDGFTFDPELMHFDGVNANAPILPPGEVELAAQFGRDAMEFYAGKQIDAVQLFIYQEPAAPASLRFYANGPGNLPGQLLHQQQLTGLQPNGWNIVELDTPVEFPSEDLWISVYFPEGGQIQVLGCDAGPRQDGGDWMYQEPDQTWQPFSQRSSDRINWNIRAMVTE